MAFDALTIADAALAEAEEARAYYASIRAELGDDFALTLNRAFDLVANGPLLWSPIGARARRYVLSRFPYSVVYRVQHDAIVVIAVMHQHRRPATGKAAEGALPPRHHPSSVRFRPPVFARYIAWSARSVATSTASPG